MHRNLLNYSGLVEWIRYGHKNPKQYLSASETSFRRKTLAYRFTKACYHTFKSYALVLHQWTRSILSFNNTTEEGQVNKYWTPFSFSLSKTYNFQQRFPRQSCCLSQFSRMYTSLEVILRRIGDEYYHFSSQIAFQCKTCFVGVNLHMVSSS